MKIPKVIGMEFVEWKGGFGFVPVLDAEAKVYRAVSLGRIKPDLPAFLEGYFKRRKCYVVTHWYSFALDGDWLFDFQVVLDPHMTKKAAHAEYKKGIDLWEKTDLEALSACFEPELKPVVLPARDVDGQDLFKARLEVFRPVAANVVRIFSQSLGVEDPAERERLQHEAVQAYVADLAAGLTDEEFGAWQEKNPLDKKWIEVLAKNLRRRQKALDPINYELALNWINRRYNEMEPKDLAEVIYQVTGQQLSPVAIRKRYYRKLGLMTKRKPGARLKR